jgi:signal transduction histidine kinase
MRSRATEIGGWIEIESAPGSGTLVRAGVPAETERS